MGQSTPFKPIALVVEDDELQREMVAMLLEECEMGVIQCETAEAALGVLEKLGPSLSMLYTDVNLPGSADGVKLAQVAAETYPNIHVVVSSGRSVPTELPKQALFLQKPWLTLDLLREAERARTS
jgi:DNA-binding NtrC family response regulator